MSRFTINTPNAKRMFGACLLSFAMLIAPIASLGLVKMSAPRSTLNQTETAEVSPSNFLPAAGFVVNTLVDAPDETLDGDCDSDVMGTGSQCTLRAAIQEANNTAGDDSIS